MVLPCADEEGYYESIAGPREQDPDEAYDQHRQNCIDDGICYRPGCSDKLIDGMCPTCEADKLNLAMRRNTEPCPHCKGHGADPLSDNVNWLPCQTCRGSGRIPKRRKHD